MKLLVITIPEAAIAGRRTIAAAGKKNWVLINLVHGAQARTMIYSITETVSQAERFEFILLHRAPPFRNAKDPTLENSLAEKCRIKLS